MKAIIFSLCAVAAIAQQVNPLQVRGFSIQITNDAGGTTLNQLAKINSAGHAIKTGTGDTAVPVFLVIYNAGTSGLASLGVGGKFSCQMDAGGAVIGHFIVNSTATAGRCMDAGATAPTTGWVIGIAQTTAGANSLSQIFLFEGYNAAASSTAIVPYTLCSTCAGPHGAVVPASGTTITAATHGQGPGAVISCWDGATPHNWVSCGAANSAASPLVAGDVTITYAVAPAYAMIWAPGTSGGGGGGGGTCAGTGFQILTAGGCGSTAVLTSGDSSILITNPDAQAGNPSITVSTARIQSRANAQSCGSICLTETSASGVTYTATMNPTLTAYSAGMTVNWIVVTAVTGGATTINIDTLGAKSIKLKDGTTNPSAIAAGTPLMLVYDGTLFRIWAGV